MEARHALAGYTHRSLWSPSVRVSLSLLATLCGATLTGVSHGAPSELAAHDNAHVQRPSFSPDGSRLAYEANDHESKRIALFVGTDHGGFAPVRPPGVGSSGLTAGFSTAPSGAEVVHELTWSPTSLGTFAYATSANGIDSDLYIEGGGPLVEHPAPDGGAVWSPDGRHVAFTSGRTGEGDLYVRDIQALTLPPQQVTSLDGSSEVYAAWSPDSASIAFVAHGQSGDNVWLLPRLLGTPVQVTRWPGIQTHPTFSPDGTHLAFYANHEDEARFDLYVTLPQHLADPVLVLPDVIPNANGPVWTPDGAHVLAVVDDDANFDPIVAVPLARPFSAGPLDLGTVGHGDFDVSSTPGGQVRIAWAAQGQVGDDTRSFRRLYVADLPALP